MSGRLMRSITPERLRRAADEMTERASFSRQFAAADDLRRLAALLERSQ